MDSANDGIKIAQGVANPYVSSEDLTPTTFMNKGMITAKIANACCFFRIAINAPANPKTKATNPKAESRTQSNICKIPSNPISTQYRLIIEVAASRTPP